MKDLCQKWKIKLIFQGAYRLLGTGILECLEITDVGCNLKQFDGLTLLTLTPHTLHQIYTTACYDHSTTYVTTVGLPVCGLLHGSLL